MDFFLFNVASVFEFLSLFKELSVILYAFSFCPFFLKLCLVIRMLFDGKCLKKKKKVVIYKWYRTR